MREVNVYSRGNGFGSMCDCEGGSRNEGTYLMELWGGGGEQKRLEFSFGG